MTDNYISHHGIPGMKWGKQNGPPYPLGLSQKSFAERAAEKKDKLLNSVKGAGARHAIRKAEKAEANKNRAISSGNARRVAANKSEMTNKELREAIERIELERKLKSLTTPEKKTGWDRLENISKKINTGSKFVSSVSGFYAAVNGYEKNKSTYRENQEKKKESKSGD